jgi:integrase
MNQALASILLMAARELEPSLQRIHRLSVPFVSPLFDGLRREIVIAELMNCFGRRNRNDSRNINITAFLHGLVGFPREVAHPPARRSGYNQIGAFLADLRGRQGISARCLEFTILTAARTGEAIGARWDEFDLRAGIRVIPGRRMKGGQEHRAPLAPRVLDPSSPQSVGMCQAEPTK